MNLTIKQQLYKKLNYVQPYENSIKISLISTYSELIDILKTIDNKTKFLYLDNKALNKLLYQEMEIIPIENKEYDYSFLYYLSLLIIENKETIIFSLGIDFIKEIDNKKNKQENELEKLFVSRIILDLIYSYEGIKENDDLKNIKENNKRYIQDNIKIVNKYNLNSENFEEISLEKLYLNIIVELIKKKQLENYDFAHDILSKLDLENIDINQNMWEELKNILVDERYINDYKMNNIEDFFMEAKINFYYILIKYIFKNSFFIYNIPLLYNTRNTIIKIIKTKRKEFLSHFNFENIDFLKRINYIIKFMTDSNYYHNIFNEIIYENILEEAIKNNTKKWKVYMKDLNMSENYIDKMAFYIYLFESIKKDMGKTQNEFKRYLIDFKNLEKMIKDKKIKKMNKYYKLILSNYFIDNYNKDSLLRIFGKDSYDYFQSISIELNKIEKDKTINKLKQILDYYKTFFFESKKEDISSIENAIAISDQGNLDDKIYEYDYEKAKKLNDRMPLINYLYKIKDENKTESEMQQIIEKYNYLEKLILERKLNKDRNIENETLSKLFDYFKDIDNKVFLINIFGKENYSTVRNLIKKKYADEKLANYILKKSEVILNSKKEGEKLDFIFDSVNYGDYHIFINYEKLLQIKEYFIINKSENIVAKSYFKYMEFLDEFKNRIYKEFKLGYKLKIGLEFQINEKSDNASIFNIDCSYRFYSPNLDISFDQIFKEENILLNKTNSKTKGFEYLINEINKEYFKRIKLQDNAQKESIKISNNNNNISPHYYKDNNKDNCFAETIFPDKYCFEFFNEEPQFDLTIKAQDYQILKIISNIGEHKNAEYIIELSNGYFISGGIDNILKIYDKDFNLLKKITGIKFMIYSCVEMKNLSDNNEHTIELIISCCVYLYHMYLTFKDKIEERILIYDIPDLVPKNCVLLRENSFVIIGQNRSVYFKNLFQSQDNKQVHFHTIISGKSYIGSIKINQNIIAITSNKALYNGEDKLIFFNTDKKKILREIDGYSFTSGINGLTLMPREEAKVNNKVLLCACTKYFDDQKNGIYLANPQLEDKQEVNNPFYDTGNFQVFCFCPIFIINTEQKIIDTEFFLVGGFNADKKEGEIKLFKIIYNEKAIYNKIEFVQDIELERNKDFSGFEGAVSCIIQTQKNNIGHILVTCYSGKIYLLTKPNLNYYLK